MEFWDDDAKKLSRIIWKPPLRLHTLYSEKRHFKCQNKHISFKFSHLDAVELPDLAFLPVPVIDNTEEKQELTEELAEKERIRYLRDLNKSNLTKKKLDNFYRKHEEILAMNKVRVNRLDMFIRSHRNRINPTKSQKGLLKFWFMNATSVYNDLVREFNEIYGAIYEDMSKRYVEETGRKKTWLDELYIARTVINLIKNKGVNDEFPINFHKLRKLKFKKYNKKYPGMPAHMLADIIKEVVTNIEGNFTKISDGSQNHFKFKYREYNRAHQVLNIQHSDTYEEGFYPLFMGPIAVKNKSFSWEGIDHDYKLIYDAPEDRYYVHVPRYVSKKPEFGTKYPLASMDPGERTFQTLYGLNHIIEFGENMRQTIMSKLWKIDEYNMKLNYHKEYSTGNKLIRKQRSYERLILRNQRKVKHLIDELHFKTANYLGSHYERIMATDFSCRKVNKKYGPLNKTSKRVLSALSHARFRKRLEEKCAEYGSQYIEVDEAYTSKTCGQCGELKDNLGGATVYKCKHCRLEIGRDINAARNIFIKNRHEVL